MVTAVVFSLTPIFLFSLYGAGRLIARRGQLSAAAWLTAILTVAMLAFYTWNPKARNYGGSTQGLRWLFWLIPFWLIVLPAGVEAGARRKLSRVLALAALATDGIDGNTRAAGAIVDGRTCARVRASGLDPLRCLADHDSHTALVAAGDALITGPTGTNVADLWAVLRRT